MNTPVYSSVPDGKSHIIGCEIKIDGKTVLTESGTYTLHIHQKTCNHSTFTLNCRADAFESSQEFPLTNSKHLFGKKISIWFRQFSEVTFIFQGIITELNWKTEYNHTSLELTGQSPTILLEQGELCKSYENQTLEQIVTQTCENLPQDLFDLKVKPKYNTSIPYNVQYQETSFQYLQRLACRYGELLYWNGEQLVFGGYGGKKVEIQEGEDAQYIQLKMKALPQSFTLTSYQADQSVLRQSESNSLQEKHIINHFQEFALETSKKLFTQPADHFYNYPLLNRSDPDFTDTLSRKKQFQQNVLYAEAKTQNPNLRVGDLVKLSAWTPNSSIFSSGMSPVETYLILDIKHYYDSSMGYYNEFIGIPKDNFIPPYYNEKAYPKAEKQRAVVTNNNDGKGLGRVRVRFDWMKPEQQSPFIRIVFPYAGAGKGFYFLPEVGEEVMIDFENDTMEKPFVVGTLYNGKETSGYYDSNNELKVLHTNKGHVIEFDEREDSIGMTLKDKNKNHIRLDTKNNTIEIVAVDAINMKAKRMSIDIEEDMITKVGNNINVTAGKEITQFSGKKTLLHSGQNMEVEAMNHLDLYGKQKLITYTKGNAEMGALGQMHVHGTSALYSAKSTLDYKAPNMGRLAKPENFLYGKEKEIVEIIVMDKNMENRLEEILFDEEAIIVVQTRNCERGEEIIVIADPLEQGKEHTFIGVVNEEGIAKMTTTVLFENNIIPIEEKAYSNYWEAEENKEVIYKTYKGKDYTYQEWKDFEQKEWEYYQYKQKRSKFWD